MRARASFGSAVCIALAVAIVTSGCSSKKKNYFFGGSSSAAAPIVEAGFVPVGAAASTTGSGGTLTLSYSTALIPTGRTSANIVVLFQGTGSSAITTLTPTSIDTTSDNVVVTVGGAGTFQPEVQIFADQVRSSILAGSSGIVADGVTPVTLTVFAKDADGIPVGGDTVTFAVTGAPAGVTITQPAKTTDATGAATGSIVSTLAGSFTITATVTGNGGPSLTFSTTVVFVAGPLDPNKSLVGSGFNANLANGFSSIPINVTTTDKFGNPIAGLTVTIAATGSFVTLNQPSAPTDALGKTSASVASSFPQGSTVTATVQGSTSVSLGSQPQVSFVLVPHYMIVAQNGSQPLSRSGHAPQPAVNPTGSGSPSPASSPNAVAVFKVNPTSGGLTLAGSPTPTDSSPTGVAVEPRQRFVYVGCEKGGNIGTGSISAFKINDSTGALTALPGSPFQLPHPNPAASSYPLSPRLSELAITPNGQFLYCCDPTQVNDGFTAGVYGFTIDSAGALHYIQRAIPLFGQTGSGAGQAGVNSMCVDPYGRFLYVISASNGQNASAPLNGPVVTRFSIDPQLGLLTEVGSAGIPVNLAGDSPSSIGFCGMDPLGRFLYATDRDANEMYQLNIEPVSGELSPNSEADSDGALEVRPLKPAPDPFGRNVFVGCEGNEGGQAFCGVTLNFNFAGLMDPMGFSPMSLTNPPVATLALPAGLVYETDTNGGLNLFVISGSGGQATATMTTPVSGLSAPGGLAVTYGVSALP